MPTQVGIHAFPALISKYVDGGPPPAMTITTNRKVNDFAAWYNMVRLPPADAQTAPAGDESDLKERI